MISKNISLFISLILIAISGIQDCTVTDEFDYEKQPRLPINFQHLDLEMTIEPEKELVRGIATYSISAKIPGQTELILHATALEIDAVLFDKEEVIHEVSGDSLIISLDDTLSITKESELAITWQASNNFGFHKDRFGTVWASLNPRALRNWLPSYDHPRVQLSVDAEITLPANLDMVFNGVEISDEITSADQKTITFQADSPIPVTGLNFTIGNFNELEAQSGIQKVHIYSQNGIISESLQQQLLAEAVQTKRAFENALSFEYPWESLKVVVLEDGYWDVKSDAAGIVYLSLRNGNLITQLQRGIAAQWFGQFQRMESWTEQSVMMEIMKSSVLESAGIEEKAVNNPDELWELEIWNQLVVSGEGRDKFYFGIIKNSMTNLLTSRSGVINENFYTDYWYDLTGNDFWEMDMGDDEITGIKENEDWPAYGVSVSYNELDSRVMIEFERVNDYSDDLQSLTLNVYSFDDTSSTELTFSGERDSVSVTVPQSVEFVTISSATTNVQEIGYGKFPMIFLLAQLRSENVEHRRLAAGLLGYYSDNPDLQLAIKDALESETDIETKANLIETLGAYTAGATGTDMQFISELNSDYPSIQIAAIRALKRYTDNENVPGVLQQKMEVSLSDSVFEEALFAFTAVADTSQQISAANRLIRFDSTGTKTVKLLDNLSFADTTGQVRDIAVQLADHSYPFATRSKALDILLRDESSPDFWGQKIVELSDDFDPRIRLKVLEGLTFLSESDEKNIMEAVLLSEFDPRVNEELDK